MEFVWVNMHVHKRGMVKFRTETLTSEQTTEALEEAVVVRHQVEEGNLFTV
jgi:hypothetical protein